METNNEQAKKYPKLIPLTQWPEYHLWPSVLGLRDLVFYSHCNDFERVIVRIKGRILIDEEEFFSWVERNKTSK